LDLHDVSYEKHFDPIVEVDFGMENIFDVVLIEVHQEIFSIKVPVAI